jgi:hypothetical protein
MRVSGVIARAAILALLALLAIVLHEGGHFLVYWMAGIPVRVTLQSVQPVGSVSPGIDHLALLAGPLVSWLAAGVCLIAARARPGFFWSSAAFTNASIRLFPLALDIVRAATAGQPFSDEGTVVLAWTSAPPARVLLLCLASVAPLALTVLGGRSYRFADRPLLRIVGIYAYTLAIGILVLIVDILLHRQAAA